MTDSSQASCSSSGGKSNNPADPSNCIQRLNLLDLNTGSRLDKLELVLLWSDQIRALMKNGNHAGALAIMEKREELDQSLKTANHQLKVCVVLAATSRNREYSSNKDELYQIIRDKISPLPTDLLALAKQQVNEGNTLVSLVLFDISYTFILEQQFEPYPKVSLIEDCLDGILASITQVGEESNTGKRFLGNLFVPKMEEMVGSLREVTGLEPRFRSLKLASVAHDLEMCDTNNERSIGYIKAGVAEMKEGLGEQAKHYTIYGTLLNNMAATYEKDGDMESALGFYLEALDCYRSAKDYKSEESIKEFIKRGERRVRQAAGEEVDALPNQPLDATAAVRNLLQQATS